MKTIITIEHTNKPDLSSILEKVSYDVSRGYTKSSGVLPAYVPMVAPAPMAPCTSQQHNYAVEEKDNSTISTYEFYTED